MIKHGYRYFCLVLFCTASFYDLDAQVLIEGYVLDSKDNPIPYTSVYIKESPKGTFTKPDGFFSLEVDQLPVVLHFSNVGYESLMKEIVNPQNNKIHLSKRSILLDEVHIHSEKLKSRYIGSPKNKKGINSHSAAQPFYQLGLRVDNQGRKLYEESILVSVSIKIVPSWMESAKLDGTNQIRLRVYKTVQNGIGESILHENVFFAPKNGGWIKKDLEAPILLPENGFLIAVEWLKELEIVETKSRKYTFAPIYGLEIWGHTFRETADELSYYSTWEYEPNENKWQEKPLCELVIPTFRLEIRDVR
jgi:hypothetical protein